MKISLSKQFIALRQLKMYNTKISLHVIFACIALLMLIVFTFWDLKDSFFQQDEWLGQGQILAEGWKHVIDGFTPLQILFASGRPFTRIMGVVMFSNFPLSTLPFAIYSIFFHTVNTLLVFFITKKIIKSLFFSFFSAAFFAVNSISSQGVTWFGASFGLLPASTFVFLSILFFLYYKNNKRSLYISFLFAALSLYFKEIGYFLFIFLPFLYIVFHKKQINKAFFNLFLPFFLFLIIFISYEFINMTFLTQTATSPFFVTNQKDSMISKIIINTIMYSFTNLSLIYIPIKIMLSFSQKFANVYYSPSFTNAPVIENIVPEIIALVISIFLIAIFLFMQRKPHLRTPLFIACIFFLLSLLPYVIIKKGFAYMEPRYYYVTSAASGILLSLIGEYILTFFTYSYKRIGYVLLFVLFSLFVFMHIKVIRNDIAKQIYLASERKEVLKSILSLQPALYQKTIFYIIGNKQFLIPNNYVPFQQGFGYTLQVFYYKNHAKIPKSFLEQGFLWDLGSEGYKESGNNGFGYFSNLSNLKKFLREKNISTKNVVALYYNSDNHKVSKLTNLQ